MNKKKLALKVLSSPYMKKIASLNLLERKDLLKIIAEETMREQIVDPQGTDNIEKLRNVAGLAEQGYQDIEDYVKSDWEVNDLDSVLPDIDDALEVLDEEKNPQPQEWEKVLNSTVKAAIEQKNFNYASFLILGEFQKWITASKNISDVLKKLRSDQRPEAQEQIPQQIELLKSNLQVYLNIVETSIKLLKMADATPEEETGDPVKDGALKHLTSVLNAIKNNLRGWNVGRFLRLAEEEDDKFKETTLNAVKELGGTPEAAAEEVASFNGEDFEVPTEQWLELYKLLEGPVQRVNDDQIPKIINAMGKVNDFATEQKDIFWSVEEGFSQVIEVAFLQSGTDVANNGKEEKPLEQYNVSAEELNTGDVGTVLIVRSSDLFRVEKIVAEQEEPTQTVTDSIPITTVKEFNALFIGKENEEGLPTAPGAFFVKSSAEKMVPLVSQPEEQPEEQPIDDPAVDPKDISDLLKAFKDWSNRFMEVRTLVEQSKIFGDMWTPIGKISEKGKPTPIRSFTRQMASKEEEAGLTNEEVAIGDGKNTTASAPGEGGVFIGDGDANTPQEPLEQETPPEVEEAQRNILEGLVVAQRHSEKIIKVLMMYEQYAEKLTGKEANEFFKKFGTSDPREFLYKLVKLIVKDINFLLEKIIELEGPTEKLSEALLEIKGETFVDKLKKVEAVNDVVMKQVPLLLKILGNQQKAQNEPEQAKEQPPAASPAPETEQMEEQTASQRISSKETAIEVYDALATIKTYFPTVSPLDSDYKVSEAADKMKEILEVLTDHLSAMMRFKSDKNINSASLRSARLGLEQVKANIIEVFGIDDEGAPTQPSENEAGYTPEGQEGIEQGALEEPKTTDTPEKEEEPTEDTPADPVTLKNRQSIEVHIKKIIPPDEFQKLFANELPDPSLIERFYDAFTLFYVLTKLKTPTNEQEENDSVAIPPAKLQTIKKALSMSGLVDDESKTENIIVDVLNKYFKQKAKDLSFFLDSVDTSALRKLRVIVRKNERLRPFVVEMDNVPTFVKSYGGEDSFKDMKMSTDEKPTTQGIGDGHRKDLEQAKKNVGLEDLEPFQAMVKNELEQVEKEVKQGDPEASPEEIKQAKEENKTEITNSTAEKIIDQENIEPEKQDEVDELADMIFDVEVEVEEDGLPFDADRFMDGDDWSSNIEYTFDTEKAIAELPEEFNKELVKQALEIVTDSFKDFYINEAKDRGTLRGLSKRAGSALSGGSRRAISKAIAKVEDAYYINTDEISHIRRAMKKAQKSVKGFYWDDLGEEFVSQFILSVFQKHARDGAPPKPAVEPATTWQESKLQEELIEKLVPTIQNIINNRKS